MVLGKKGMVCGSYKVIERVLEMHLTHIWAASMPRAAVVWLWKVTVFPVFNMSVDFLTGPREFIVISK